MRTYLYNHLVFDENDPIREKREENGDNAHERPEFQIGHFWGKQTNNENLK